MKIPLRLAALSLLLFAGSVSRMARAADGRIPISAVPFTISAPGVYYLTQDLTLASGQAITIASSNVTLDLNNHTLTVTGTTGSNTGIYSSTTSGYTGVRITGGTIVGGGAGIVITNTSGGEYQFDHLDLLSSGGGFAGLTINATAGAVPAAHAVLDSVRVIGCVGAGIYLGNVSGGRITNSSVRGCTTGINLVSSRGILVEGNTVTDNSGIGIHLNGSSPNFSRDNAISGNLIKLNGGAGITLTSAPNNQISRNTISGNTGAGIQLATSNFNAINDNAASSSSYGILLITSSSNTVAGNAFSGNIFTSGTTGNGIYLQSTSRNNTFDWNSANGNGASGMTTDGTSTANIFSYNRFAGNTNATVITAGNVTAGGNNAGGGNF